MIFKSGCALPGLASGLANEAPSPCSWQHWSLIESKKNHSPSLSLVRKKSHSSCSFSAQSRNSQNLTSRKKKISLLCLISISGTLDIAGKEVVSPRSEKTELKLVTTTKVLLCSTLGSKVEPSWNQNLRPHQEKFSRVIRQKMSWDNKLLK